MLQRRRLRRVNILSLEERNLEAMEETERSEEELEEEEEEREEEENKDPVIDANTDEGEDNFVDDDNDVFKR